MCSQLLDGERLENLRLTDETITFEEKNVNQFVIKHRPGTSAYPVGTAVTYGANVSGNGVDLLIFGILYNVNNSTEYPHASSGDLVEISESGFLTDDVKIFDAQNNLRWITTSSTPGSSINASVTSQISKF